MAYHDARGNQERRRILNGTTNATETNLLDTSEKKINYTWDLTSVDDK